MKKKLNSNLLLASALTLIPMVHPVWANPPSDLELEDPEDIELLMEEFSDTSGKKRLVKKDNLDSLDMEDDDLALEEGGDDFDSLKEDIGDIEFTLPEDDQEELKLAEDLEKLEKKNASKKINIIKDDINGKEAKIIFDVGREEKELLEVAKKMRGKIANSEWNEIAGKATSGTYEVVNGDWLWKISQRLFGSGFYYSKIWALNPYITNPHEIEPGMILSFSTGSDNNLPSINLDKARKNLGQKTGRFEDEFDRWGEDAKPAWITEREKLKEQGVYLQYSSADTQDDLKSIGDEGLIKEYEVYEPPKLDFAISVPDDEFDESGFDKNAKVVFNFKEGFYLNTFLSTNVVQDFGKIVASHDEKGIFSSHDTIYVKFDQGIDVVPGDKFSVYSVGGERSHDNSDRKGFKYTITGSFKTIQKHDDLWEIKLLDTNSAISRGDRITVYTPKIERVTKTYNSRIIEAVLMSAFQDGRSIASFGDVVYLDRGRADGVEVGNVFEVYGFKDRGTGKNITDNPTYKNGELTVITVTDNFSTALVSQSTRDFAIGDIAVTKTKEAAARATKLREKVLNGDATRMTDKALEELDVELNLDDLNDALLDKADKIQFTEDELAELERQEREKSIITENEKDLRALERLESELETAEKMLNEARLDEDKLLEGQDLNKIENDFGVEQQESLDEIEENFGKRYLDEDLNDKENPYGLTEFDIEEIDELLNSDKE